MFWFLICAFLLYGTEARNSPVVSTRYGQLKGSVLTSRNGRDYFSFTKVPFAKPPIGKLRFKDPVKLDPWNGVLEATRLNPVCYQILKTSPMGSEDCLYLNVYTPKLTGSMPVMIYFFGGGWRVGMPGPATNAKNFMEEDVVLVMINYRLGSLGFMSTEDDKVPGNMGLKDMAAALEWTKSEISNFGGDPNLITAFGLSAGAASSHYLCSIPQTKAMLKGCISQSGVGGSHWSLRQPGASRAAALTIANSVGCTFEDILSCLQSKTAEEIVKVDSKLKFWIDEPLIIHGPLLEHKHEGALLTEWPLSDSNFPWLTGVTSNEGAFKSFVLVDMKDKPIMDDFGTNKAEYLKKMLNLPVVNKDTVDKINQRFFVNGNVIDGIEKLYGEAYFIYPALHELKKHHGPKYFYEFNVTGGASVWETVLQKENINTNSGVAHGDDLPFFYDLFLLPPKSSSKMSKPEMVRISQLLIKLFVNFAKYQKPTIEGSGLDWHPYEDKKQYLFISNEKFENKEYNGVDEILEFWDSIFYKSSSNDVNTNSDEL